MTFTFMTSDFLSKRTENGKQKDFFDAHADVWDDISRSEPSKLRYITDLLGLKGDEEVLDVGCGTGVMIPYYLEHLRTGKVTAVDFSERMIAKASSKYPPSERISYMVRDVSELDGSEVFDVAVCYSCFPHFNDPVGALSALSGCLRKGGRLAIAHSDSKEHINSVHHEGGKEIRNDFLPDVTIMEELFANAGLELEFARDDADYYIVIGRRA